MIRRGESMAAWALRMDENARQLEARTHYVYRAFDADGRLLYIGCTVDLAKRMSQHRKSAEWWEFVAELTTHSYPSRSTARAAEELAIHSEGAYFNRFPGNQFTANTPATVGVEAYRLIRQSEVAA